MIVGSGTEASIDFNLSDCNYVFVNCVALYLKINGEKQKL